MTAENDMMDPLARDIRIALDKFLAEVMNAAERRALEAVRHAFREMTGSAAFACAKRLTPTAPASPTRAEGKPSQARLLYLRSLTPEDLAMRPHVLSLLRQHPGMGRKQLAQAMNLDYGKIRRFLAAMWMDGEVRFDEISIGAIRRQRYFVADGLQGTGPVHEAEPVHHGEVTARPAGAPA